MNKVEGQIPIGGSSPLGGECNNAVTRHDGGESVFPDGEGLRWIRSVVCAASGGEDIRAIQHAPIKRGVECVDPLNDARATIAGVAEANRILDRVVFRKFPKCSDCLDSRCVAESGLGGG